MVDDSSLPPSSPSSTPPSCFVLAAPSEIDIPGRLSSSLLASDAPLYAQMLPGEPFVSDTVEDGKRVVSNTFSPSNSSSPFPLIGMPPLPDPILALNPVFGTKVTQVEVFVHKVKVIAILDTGSPVNVISSKLSRRIKLAPD